MNSIIQVFAIQPESFPTLPPVIEGERTGMNKNYDAFKNTFVYHW